MQVDQSLSVRFALSHSLRLRVSAVAFALLSVGLVPAEALAARPKTSGEAKASLVSLRLFPQKAKLLGASGSQRFVVLGKYSDGLERDVTGFCPFLTQRSQPGGTEPSGPRYCSC